MENETKADSREWELDAETEYRFELDPGTSLAIKVRSTSFFVFPVHQQLFQLVHGQAEVFGTELAEGKQYLFGSECKASIFTWQGCTLEMSSCSQGISVIHSYLRGPKARHRASFDGVCIGRDTNGCLRESTYRFRTNACPCSEYNTRIPEF
jgi:hypothetical protein